MYVLYLATDSVESALFYSPLLSSPRLSSRFLAARQTLRAEGRGLGVAAGEVIPYSRNGTPTMLNSRISVAENRLLAIAEAP
jgi:hypothetical protein